MSARGKNEMNATQTLSAGALALMLGLAPLTGWAQDTTEPEAGANDLPDQRAPADSVTPPEGGAPDEEVLTTTESHDEVTGHAGEQNDGHVPTSEAEGDHGDDDGHGAGHVTDYDFSFEGPFGSFDQFQLQRGLQVFTEVCSGCHGLRYVPLRTLADENGVGLPEDQVRAYAAQYFEVLDEETGDFRPARPTDNFPANTAVGAPDLSLMAKARAGFHGPYGTGINQFVKGMGGAEYIASVLTGYTGETREEAGVTLYQNTAFPGGWISMAPPLLGDDVVYQDGHSADVVSEAKDVSAFLMWAAEPKMMDRKHTGFVAVLFLAVLTVLLWMTNRRLWAPHKKKSQPAE
jgi:ubiquinol-cytochrome c reductase cytochrome c1 subunit